VSNTKIFFSLLFFIFITIWAIQSCNEELNSPDKNLENLNNEEALYFKDYESPEEKWGYLDTTGQMAIDPIFDHAREFSEGLAAVNFNGKWGYINSKGEWIIPASFRAAYSFKNGIARIQTLHKKYGFIKKTGDFILAPIYDEIYDFHSARARLINGPVQQYINSKGDTINRIGFPQASDFKNGWARVKEVFYGFIDTTGKKIIETKYERIYYPSGDMIRFKLNGKYGFLNKNGRQLIPPEYDFATDFQKDVAMARQNDASFLLNKQGGKIPIQHKKAISSAGEDLWKVKDINGLWCLLNSKAELLGLCNYTVINNFYDELAAFERDDYWGFLDTNGEEVIPPIFPLVWDFKEGKARVIYRNGVGYIDKKGELVIPGYYFENRDFSEGLARVQVF
jgi:hypothetical protein